MRLKIIFLGTPDFAVSSLKMLVENKYDIVGVVTAPDKYGGRGRKQLIMSDVKKFALKHNLNILQPTNLKSKEFLNQLNSLNADLQVIVAFRMLPEVVWNMPPLGTYNLHGSLLPKYRGAAPIHWAIMNGERETGVSSFKLKHEIDTGDMLLQRKMSIKDNDTLGSVYDKLKALGAQVVLESVRMIESGNLRLRPQPDIATTKAPKLNRENCQLNFNLPTHQVYNKIRGLDPFPSAWCKIDGKTHKIFKSRGFVDGLARTAGNIFTDNKSYLTISTNDGYIHVLEIQQEGKKKMLITELLNGYNFKSESIDPMQNLL